MGVGVKMWRCNVSGRLLVINTRDSVCIIAAIISTSGGYTCCRGIVNNVTAVAGLTNIVVGTRVATAC